MWIRIRATTWDDDKLYAKAKQLFDDENVEKGSYAISCFKTSQIKKFDFLKENTAKIDKAIMSCFFRRQRKHLHCMQCFQATQNRT